MLSSQTNPIETRSLEKFQDISEAQGFLKDNKRQNTGTLSSLPSASTELDLTDQH